MGQLRVYRIQHMSSIPYGTFVLCVFERKRLSKQHIPDKGSLHLEQKLLVA
jgi:hypothetical protein